MDQKGSDFSECVQHPERNYRYICLVPECAIEPKSCILCIRENHKQCNDEQIVSIKDFVNHLIIKNRQHGDAIAVRDYVKDFVDVSQIELLSKFKRKKEMLKRIYQDNKSPTVASLTEEQIKILRNRCIWRYNADRDIIEIRGPASLGYKQIKCSMDLYQRELQAKINKFSASLAKINLQFTTLDISVFDYDAEKIKLELNGSGVNVVKLSDENATSTAVVYKKPLCNNRFKITITHIEEDDKTLDIGVMTGSRYQNLQNENPKFTIGFGSSGTVSFSGHSMNRMKLVGGKISNHCVNSVYWLQFNTEGKEVKIYNKEGLHLKNASALTADAYHFYVMMKYTDVSCEIEIESE